MRRVVLVVGLIGLVAIIATAILLRPEQPVPPVARVGPGVPSAGFILRNDTEDAVTVRRADPPPSHPRRLGPGESADVNQTHAWLRDFDWTELNRGTALTLEVVDTSGVSRGKIAFTPLYMRGVRGFTICLSAAAEPPYLVDQYQDAAGSCRTSGGALSQGSGRKYRGYALGFGALTQESCCNGSGDNDSWGTLISQSQSGAEARG